MYIDSITIENFRTFRSIKIDFTHKDRKPTKRFPAPKLANINLLLGNNGLGKTTLLKAISLASLGPAVSDSGIFPYQLVRHESRNLSLNNSELSPPQNEAKISAKFFPHKQDRSDYKRIESEITIYKRGDLEQMRWTHEDEKSWHPIYSRSSDAFFFVGYGATRRVEKLDQANISGRKQSSFARAQRILSLFEEAYSLLPLSSWLPRYKEENPGRYKQVINLINKIMSKEHYQFTGEMIDNEYIFEKQSLQVPFPALSDGYRAFLGWIGDLLYHICETCPSGSKLVDNYGIVMVDEIDLHIHPKWQLTVLPVLAEALPNIQFIVTTHSPLIVGSLEWMNIISMVPSSNQSSVPKRIKQGILGMDADQILLTDFFGLKSTRSHGKEQKLQELTEKARKGDVDSAKELLKELSQGME